MIVLATNKGLVLVESGSWQVIRRSLEGQHLTSVIAREGVILAGTLDGIFRSDDEGRTWREASAGLGQRHVRWLAFHPEISDFEVAGTEPANIYISRDGGGSWNGSDEVTGLRDQFRWYLPYSPQAGCVRGFAFAGKRLYAAVEVGGVLRSDDLGSHWRLAEGSDGRPDLNGPLEPFIYPDLHSIYVHPTSPDLVFAATGGGFYISTDSGKTWRLRYDCYCRAAWIDSADAAHIILGPADHVQRGGRIEETHDGGETWRLASAGLSVPWPHHMVERFTQAGADLLAVLSNGQLLAAPLNGLNWRVVLPEIEGVNALAVVEA
jgi:photosystem II stability/assembly factor-like uncharacterized protein